ncbi:MAG: hypothetical protein RJA70_4144 [Pseudomonadota bacterium]
MDGLSPGTRVLSVFLVNDRTALEHDRDINFAFQVAFTLRYARGFVARPNRHGEGSSSDDQRVLALLFRDKYEWAVGHNTSVQLPGPNAQGLVTELCTTQLPQSIVKDVKHETVAGVVTGMLELANMDGAALANTLTPLVDHYAAWIQKQRDVYLERDDLAKTRTSPMDKASAARLRMAEGIRLLSAPEEVPGAIAPEGAMFAAYRIPKARANLPTGLSKLVIVLELREVRVQVSFSRFDSVSANLQGEYDFNKYKVHPMTPPLLSPLLSTLSGYVAGAFLPPVALTFAVHDPATGLQLAELPSFGRAATEQAVAAAAACLLTPTTIDERRGWLLQLAAAHQEHRETLAQIITAENGKTLREARAEVDYAASFYAAAARSIACVEPRVIATQVKNYSWTVHARPAGVAALIVPWNFPLAMLAKKAAAALAAGAPFVAKPSEKTPLSAVALFHLLHPLGLPGGMANLVFGDAPAIGQVLCEHPAVRVISFTGSTAVGKRLAAQAAPHLKRLALELGGNAPLIVFEDADLERAANQLITNKFRCSGQTCVSTNRVYVQASVAERFAQLVASRMAALNQGPGCDAKSDLGPLIDRAGFAKVRGLVSDALERGARLVVGTLPDGEGGPGALFYPPTLLDNLAADSSCLREEVFGPVIPLLPFTTEDEVVQTANNTEHGLAAYVFTSDSTRAERVIARLQFGHVGLNSAIGPVAEAPFGGMKQSGYGREGGEEGILEFIELQTLATPLT